MQGLSFQQIGIVGREGAGATLLGAGKLLKSRFATSKENAGEEGKKRWVRLDCKLDCCEESGGTGLCRVIWYTTPAQQSNGGVRVFCLSLEKVGFIMLPLSPGLKEFARS